MHFRPGDLPQGDPSQPNTPVEWEDNWLSNTFAWASYKFVPAWCQSPEHFTSRFTAYLFSDCPCCLFWRGITIGAIFAFTISALIAIALCLLLR